MWLLHTAVFLTAAVVAVPLFQRIGLGTVLGYLAAGVIIGPSGLGLIQQVDDTLHIAEFGGPSAAFVVGPALALSSTALVLQLLGERHELATTHGRAAFGIFLFQDLAAIPRLGVHHVLRELYGSSLEATVRVLEEAGLSGDHARQAVRQLRQHDEALMQRQMAAGDDEAELLRLSRDAAVELEQILTADDRSVT